MPRKRKICVVEVDSDSNRGEKKVKMSSAATQKKASSAKKVAKSRGGPSLGFYLSGTSTNVVPPIQQNLNKIFDQYRDDPKEFPDTINIDGAQRYLGDINVGLDEVAFLAVSDLLQCPSVGEFDRDAFVSGWRSASTTDKPCDTIVRQAQHVDTLRKNLSTDPAYLKQVYRNAFKLSKPEGQRSVPVDTAIDMWNLFFQKAKGGIEWNTANTKWLDLWCEFYESQSKRPVNKDLWNMVGELVMKIREPGGESLGWWTEDGAWPMAVDEFVAFVKEKRKADGDSMDTS